MHDPERTQTGGLQQQQFSDKMIAAVHRQQLPTKAVIEGPAACFRLLEIDDGLGMTHDQFVALFLSTTDNMMTLEDIHEAWARNPSDVNESPRDCSEAAVECTNTCMLLPSFLRAFTDLAMIKYRGNLGKGGDNDSVNHLLLRDVYDNITNPTSTITRYGVCAQLIDEDVCSFLVSQRSFTSNLFATYGEASKSPRCHVSAEDKKECMRRPLSPRQESEQKRRFSENHIVTWGGFLAIASDLQLIPRLMGLDSLRVAVERVSVVPHRLGREDGVDPPLVEPLQHRNAGTKRAVADMSYPQFVEVLSLLAIFAAGRLRLLYPGVAGPEPSPAADGPTDDRKFSDSGTHSGTSRSGRLPTKSESAGAATDTSWSEKTRSRISPRVVRTQRKALDIRAAVRLESGRSALGTPTTPIIEERAKKVIPRYDLGVLKALFHHARVAFQEKYPASAVGRGQSRPNTPRSSTTPPRRGAGGAGMFPSAHVRDRAPRQSTGLIGGEEMEVEWANQGKDALGHEGIGTKASSHGPRGDAAVANPKSKLSWRNQSFPGEERVLEQVIRRVSDLEGRLLTPQTTHQSGPFFSTVDTGGGGEQLPPKSFPPEAGGSFARLVVVKELQPVPEHAPGDARHLLELTLDHHQAGRYALALETLEKGVVVWSELLGTDPGEREPKDPAHELEASDEALALLLEASIHQSAGSDTDALSTLLTVDEVIDSIPENRSFLREAFLATILNEMGVTLYYSSQVVLSLRCFRLALFVRQELLRSDNQSVSDKHGGESREESKDWKGASGYRARDPNTVVAEAGGAATAIALNNFGVCLAGIGEAGAAAQALVISSTITTAVLGVEHPRSSIIWRNLAIVKAIKSLGKCGASDGCTSADPSAQPPTANRWEEEIWRILGSKRVEDLPLYNAVAKPTSRVIPGGFLFAGKLYSIMDGRKTGAGKRTRTKKGMKKRGASARRR